jgi:hypothetical protein
LIFRAGTKHLIFSLNYALYTFIEYNAMQIVLITH